MASRSKFSDLPADILQIIYRKLSFIQDFVVFGVVCTLWRSVVFQYHLRIIPPVLMFPDPLSENILIYCFSDLSRHVLSTATAGSYYYCGSSHGWLMIRRMFCHLDKGLQLVNPFSSVNNVIQLLFPKNNPWKVVLSNDPLKTSTYVVVIIDDSTKLFFFKAGDTSWTPVDFHTDVLAIMYYRDQIYAIDFYGILISCDINSTPLSVKKVASIEPGHIRYNSHLLELAGDLLYVNDNGNYRSQRKNIEFQVFKVEPREVLELNNLSGYAIFLSYKSLVAVLASDFPNCKPDHIYFSMQGFSGSFNLIDKSSHYFQLPEFESFQVWIQTTLDMIKLDDYKN